MKSIARIFVSDSTVFLLPAVLLLSACSPSPLAIQTAIAQTQAAWTPTAAPTPTVQPTGTSTGADLYASMWTHCILGDTMTTQYYDQLLQQRTCIYGVIARKTEMPGGGTIYAIFPLNKPVIFLIVAPAPKKLREAFPNAPGVLTNADVGDCIAALGCPSSIEGSGNQFIATDVLDIPQLVSALGASNSTVQEMITVCN
jgi:hypothetical protein